MVTCAVSGVSKLARLWSRKIVSAPIVRWVIPGMITGGSVVTCAVSGAFKLVRLWSRKAVSVVLLSGLDLWSLYAVSALVLLGVIPGKLTSGAVVT